MVDNITVSTICNSIIVSYSMYHVDVIRYLRNVWSYISKVCGLFCMYRAKSQPTEFSCELIILVHGGYDDLSWFRLLCMIVVLLAHRLL